MANENIRNAVDRETGRRTNSVCTNDGSIAKGVLYVSYDAIVIGTGPNGLAAAITLAQAGQRVLVVEAKATPGGGMRTQAITLPGFQHDICAAVHPLGLASPFLRGLPLADYGLEWILPPVSLAHPLDDGSAVAVTRSLDETAAELGQDGAMWRRLFGTLVANWEDAIDGRRAWAGAAVAGGQHEGGQWSSIADRDAGLSPTRPAHRLDLGQTHAWPQLAQKQCALLAYVHSLLPVGACVELAGDSEFGAIPVLRLLAQWGGATHCVSFDLEASRLQTTQRLSRLTLAVALLYVTLLTFGSQTIKRGLRPLIDRTDRRDLSIFRVGVDMFERLLANAQPFSIRLLPYFT